MPNRFKSSRKYKRKNNRKSRRKVLKAGNGTQVKCSMCEKMVNKDDTLVPSGCLTKHGKGAHRICNNCWWNSEKGFASEGMSHKCPGCEKGLPLTPFKKPDPIFIDLTKESD
jgi:hypothetical protein